MFDAITLITDFGSFYPGVVKCVIHSTLKCLNHKAEVIDVCHDVEPFNVFHGAFLLYNYYKYINAVHCAIVDPTVGGERKAIAVVCEKCAFVGPDNGILYPAAKEAGIRKIYEIRGAFEFLSTCVGEKLKLSTTFHGRDVFAPAASIVAAGKIEEFGEELKEMKELDLFDFKVDDELVECRIVFNDRFGNAVTNVKSDLLEGVTGVEVKGIYFPLVKRIPDVEVGETFAIVGSFSTLELCVREGSAKELGFKTGKIKIRLVR